MPDLAAHVTRRPEGSTITLVRTIRTTPEDLWQAIVDPARAARWLGVLTGELSAGGRYRITFDDADPSAVVEGEVLRCAPGQELEVTWQAPGDPVSRVRATLEPVAEGTLLTLVHDDLREADDAGHAAGWQLHLDQLTAGMESDDWTEHWEDWAALAQAYAAAAVSATA